MTPVHLDLRDRRVLVVGGGPVALRRASALARAGAAVVVVAPEVAPGMPGEVHVRRFVPADLDGAWLVVTATGTVDAEVAALCERRGTWCVRADDAVASAAWLPAAARVDDVVLSVTAGRDPRRAVALRDALALAVQTGEVPLRRSRPGPGSVALVGGGPGDPDLLTVRGRRLLAGADVVVRDRGAPAAPLTPGVEVVEVGGSLDVGALLVQRARAGQRVVRLVAGDLPDGGELAACRAGRTPVEVVPGVAAVAGRPQAAGRKGGLPAGQADRTHSGGAA